MPVQGEEPFEEDLDWLKYGREMIQDSPKILDEAARSFLTLGSSLLTVYTGALALFKFNDKASGLLSWAIICIPILLWLLCISCFAYVYFPDRLKFRKNSPSDIEDVTVDVSRKKSRRLKIGSILFVAALAATSISIVWLGTQPVGDVKTEEQTVNLVIAEDEAAILRNLSGLPQDAPTGAYIIVILNDGNGTYQMQNASGMDATGIESLTGRMR